MASNDRNKLPTDAHPAKAGEHLEREYGHSSGDRNTRTDERDWKHFKDGKERTEHADAPPESDDSNRRV